jgi:hypothetical protein
VSLRHGADAAELDRLLPRYQFTEHHCTTVAATAERTFAAVEAVDLTDSRIARVLQALWRIPARLFMRAVPNRSMSVKDFVPLARVPPRHVVRGLVSGGGPRTWTAETFVDYAGPGFKLAWSYTVTELGPNRSRIDTETRVLCCDDATKRWFTLYWAIIRPWSGLIRRDLLRLARQRAEAASD